MAKSSKKARPTPKAAVKLSVVSGAEPVPAPAEALETLEPVSVTEAAEVPPPEAPAATVQVRKKDFVERVAARSGAKKPVARDLTEAVLDVLAQALARGESLALPPLGKLTVLRQTDKAGGEVLHLKLKRTIAEAGAKKDDDSGQDPLAEDQD